MCAVIIRDHTKARANLRNTKNVCDHIKGSKKGSKWGHNFLCLSGQHFKKKKFTLFHGALTLVPKITSEEEFQNTLTDMSITGMPVYSGLNNPRNTRRKKEWALAWDNHTATWWSPLGKITQLLNPPKWFLPSQNPESTIPETHTMHADPTRRVQNLPLP